jgi:hypothetical protein
MLKVSLSYLKHLMEGNIGQPYVSKSVDVNSMWQVERLISPTVNNITALRIQR